MPDTSNTHEKTTHTKLAWVVTLTASLFFFYEFIQMNLFNAINEQLREAFHLDAVQLGQLFSMYFYANFLCLFPAGNLLDRYSTTKITHFCDQSLHNRDFYFFHRHRLLDGSSRPIYGGCWRIILFFKLYSHCFALVSAASNGICDRCGGDHGDVRWSGGANSFRSVNGLFG